MSPYLAEGTVTWRNQMGDEAVTVPAGCVFVMGDNRGPAGLMTAVPMKPACGLWTSGI